MKKYIKRIIVIVLTLALSIGGISFVAPSRTNADADFAITAPSNGSLRAAGYIDITWESADSIGNVESYDVFVDGTLVKNTTDTKYEFYTTKVNYHKAWIRANFTNGTSHYCKTVRFGVTKKGLAMGKGMGYSQVNPAELNAAWYYNWGVEPYSLNKYKKLEYVPMVWGDKNATDIQNKVDNAVNDNYKYILGFNEPDVGYDGGGCNMDTSDAIDLWPNFLGKNIKVGSPAYGRWGDSSEMNQFMVGVENNVDFVCLHCYPANWNGGTLMADWMLESVVDDAYNRYHKPIWLTEYSTSGNGITQSGTESFIKSFLPGMDSRDYVERYSFFSFNADEFGGGLWSYSTGELTKSGNAYANNGNPEEDYVTGSEVNPRDAEETTEPTTTPQPTTTNADINASHPDTSSGIWSFSQGGAYSSEEETGWGNVAYINSVKMNGTDETIGGWLRGDNSGQTQSAAAWSNGFYIDIENNGWDRNWKTDPYRINPWSIQGITKATMVSQHAYRVTFKAKASKKKYAYVGFSTRVDGNEMAPYDNSPMRSGSNNQVIVLNDEEKSFTYIFDNYVGGTELTTSIRLGAFGSAKDGNAYDYTGKDISDIVTGEETKWGGNVTVSDFKVEDLNEIAPTEITTAPKVTTTQPTTQSTTTTKAPVTTQNPTTTRPTTIVIPTTAVQTTQAVATTEANVDPTTVAETTTNKDIEQLLSEISSLKDSLGGLKSLMDILPAGISIPDEISKLQDSIKEIEKELENVDISQIANNKEQLEALKTKVTEATNKVAELTNKVSKELAEEIQKQIKDNKDLSDTLNTISALVPGGEFKDQIDSIKEKIQNSNGDIKEISDIVAQIQDALKNEPGEQIDAAKIKELVTKLKEETKQINNVDDIIQKVKDEISKLIEAITGKKTDETTTAVVKTTSSKDSKAAVKAPGTVKIKKVNAKKKSSKKIKIRLKKVNGAKGYQVAVYKTKKNAKKNKKAIAKKFYEKTKITFKSKKFKNKKKLFVRARAYAIDGKLKVFGKWSKVKKVKVK